MGVKGFSILSICLTFHQWEDFTSSCCGLPIKHIIIELLVYDHSGTIRKQWLYVEIVKLSCANQLEIKIDLLRDAHSGEREIKRLR
ncbi:hypothetical protein MKX03_025191 [Papaver bracteatum]|nr:hypothetical protein MKX03_025191 [Papaver bracteatum]